LGQEIKTLATSWSRNGISNGALRPDDKAPKSEANMWSEKPNEPKLSSWQKGRGKVVATKINNAQTWSRKMRKKCK